MADPGVRIASEAGGEGDDVPMGSSGDAVEVNESGTADVAGGSGDEDGDGEAAGEEKPAETQIAFVDYLKSPIITLYIGPSTSEQTTLFAHRALLTRSPSFASALDKSTSQDSSNSITLEDEDLSAVSAMLEYLYTGEYFPPKHPSGTSLLPSPSIPAMDTTGSQLLHHAKVYTLAEKLGLPPLKHLSHSKIHLISSTASAELIYARYVYQHTGREDTTIRKPVASFWGQRSHVLRHETEGDFRKMCLEFPEFAFDVLSFVLDVEEKRERRHTIGHDGTPGGDGKGRKRARGGEVRWGEVK